MEQTCPHCGKKNIDETAVACPACGQSPGKSARRAREYDGYAVGRRVLRLAPAWLLLIAATCALTLLFFSWMNRHGGESVDEAFRNEATNRPTTTPEVARAAGSPSRPAPTAQATPAPPAEAKDEAGSYAVQVGAYAELSQANERVSRVRAAGFEARVVESNETTHFRFQVRSGLYATRGEAAHLAADLRARGVAGDTVIVEPEKK
jgi:hypothetical protein